MYKRKGMDSVVSIIPWLILAIIFIGIIILFVTNRFESLGELIKRVLPIPG